MSGAHYCAYTGARNHANRDAFFFEDFENPNVRDAAGKASTQGDTDCGHALRFSRIRPAGQFAAEGLHRPDNFSQTLHRSPTSLVCRGSKPHSNMCKMSQTRFELQATFVLSGGYKTIRPILPECGFPVCHGD